MEYRVGMKLVQRPIMDTAYPEWSGVVLTVVKVERNYIYFMPSVRGRGVYSYNIIDKDFMISKPRILENE